MAELNDQPSVHIIVYHETRSQYVGLDVCSSFEKALELFERRLKETRDEHVDDPDWVTSLTRDVRKQELFFDSKSGYEVFYRREIVQ